MGFAKGRSGNPKGRPKMSDNEKEQREEFKNLLHTATVPALRSIIEIANSKCSKDRFNACKFIIEKAFGNNTVFLSENIENIDPIVIRVMPYQKADEGNKDEDWEEKDPDEDWEE